MTLVPFRVITIHTIQAVMESTKFVCQATNNVSPQPEGNPRMTALQCGAINTAHGTGRPFAILTAPRPLMMTRLTMSYASR